MSEGVEMEIQRYAVLAVTNLATDSETHDTFIAEGMLSKLVSLSNAKNDEIRQYAAFSLCKMAQNSDIRMTVFIRKYSCCLFFISNSNQRFIFSFLSLPPTPNRQSTITKPQSIPQSTNQPTNQ